MPEPRRVSDEFYIGYLDRAPPGHGRLVVTFVILVLALAVSIGAILAASQADPGSGQYQFGIVTEHRGLLVLEPCPALVQPADVPGGPARIVLLVGTGKCGALDPPGACGPKPWDPRPGPGAPSILRGLAGQTVTVKGSIIERGGRRMIEIADLYDAVRADTANSAGAAPAVTAAEPATLVGEVVDPKCFLGAMKPARGATHRDCAVRCLRGGIPPMLAGADGRLTLLVDPQGAPAGMMLAPFAGDRVSIRGEFGRFGDLDVVRVSGVHRD